MRGDRRWWERPRGKPENAAADHGLFSQHSPNTSTGDHLLSASAVSTADTDVLKNKGGGLLPRVTLTPRRCASHDTHGDWKIEQT